MSAELSGKIDAFLRKAHPYGFAANIQTVTQLFDKAAQDLFHRRRKRGGKGGHLPPPLLPLKFGENIFSFNYYLKFWHFSVKYRVKFGNFVNFSGK